MPNCGSPRRATTATVAVWLLVCLGAEAQQPTARERYESATEREEKVRALLTDQRTPASQVPRQVAQVLASFESLVRRFPTSGYADNALFQAASLAEAAYQRFKRAEDLERALRFYRWLIQEYPHSSLVKPANARVDSLASPPPAARATLLKIDRAATRELVRVTIELDREVEYLEQRLAGPERVFFDLRDVQVIPELLDQVLTYPSDVVTKIRIGRHPNAVVRVVLDLEDVKKYSVFTLYNPFRLVVDAERTDARAAALFPPLLPATPFSVSSLFGVMPRAAFVVPERPELPPAPLEPLTATAPRLSSLAPAVAAAAPHGRPAPPKGNGQVAAVPATPSANAAGGFSIARQLGLSVSRIVIDPGHGGHDPGVLGKGLTEATLVLDVSLRLEKLLQKDEGVDVVLTRRTNVYVPLEERTEIANRQNADMFLSIHANASRNTDARGVETFFLSFASSPDAEAVAARENSASNREMHQLQDLVKAITLNNKLDESRDLANMVQDSLVGNLRKSNRDIRSRGVKKAPFVVLIGAAMPSVLAEISFVSNARELALLKTAAYRQKIAEALYAAVTKYRRSLKNQTLTDLPDR
jgi:N-acetylmuramoyl-L-alanine amidase